MVILLPDLKICTILTRIMPILNKGHSWLNSVAVSFIQSQKIFLTYMQCKNQTLWQYQSRVRVFIVFYFLAGHLMSYAMVGLTKVSSLLNPIEVTYVCACSTVKDIPPLCSVMYLLFTYFYADGYSSSWCIG